MSQGFYEMLGVKPAASEDDIRQAFQGRLAALVRRLKAARKQGADVSLLESQERALREAVEVLADPARRRRYDAFRRIVESEQPPNDASELWQQCRGSLMDPATVSALNVIRGLTDLPVGDPIPDLPSREQLRTGRRPRPTPAPAPAPAAATAPPPSGVAPPLQMRPPSIAIPMPTVPSPASATADEQPTEPGTGSAPRFTPRPAPPPLSQPPPPTFRDDLPPPRPLDVPVMPSPPPEPEEETVEVLARRFGYDGRFLRAVRESQGMSLEALSRATHISRRYLEALEGNLFDRLPTRVFVRGYVVEIARELDIEETEIVSRYLDLYDQNGG